MLDMAVQGYSFYLVSAYIANCTRAQIAMFESACIQTHHYRTR